MKKIRTLFVATLTAVFLSLSACNINETPATRKSSTDISSSTQSSEIDEQIYRIYQLYKAQGGNLSYEEWLQTIKGEKGDQGEPGIPGSQGPKGEDGHSPIIEIRSDGYWYIDGVNTNVKAQGSKGETGNPGKNGVSIVSVTKTNTDGLVDTYTILYSDDSTSTFTVTNGQNGEQGTPGIQGQPGKDGHTPIVTISNDDYWVIDGEKTSFMARGPQGETGQNGKSAYEIYLEAHPEYTKSEDEWLDDLVNGRLGNKELHTVSFDSQGGSQVASQQILHGEKAQKPADPFLDGYVFDGWYYQNELWVFQGYVVTEDMTLTARWSEGYQAVFLNHDDTVLYSCWFKKGSDPVYPYANPTMTDDDFDYQFKGWEKHWNENDQFIVKAQYEKASKCVSFIGNTAYINGTDIAPTDVIIPSTWDGENITHLGSSGDCSTLTSITIPNSVTTIYRQTFRGCTSLVTITIPDSVEIIDNLAFEGCTSLETVHLGNGLKTIGASAFSRCSALVDINLPDNLESIGAYAFDQCSSLKSILVGDKVTNLGEGAFSFCSKLETVVLGKGITQIKSQTFYWCPSLESITIKGIINSAATDGLIAGASAQVYLYFDDIAQLFSSPLLGKINGQMHIFINGQEDEITTITIPDSVTTLKSLYFEKLQSVRIINVPESVISIDSETFSNCPSLEAVNVDADNPNYSSQDGVLYNKSKSSLICVPMMYEGTVNLPNSTTTGITFSKFSNRQKLTAIEVGAENPDYASFNGLLYDKTLKTLISAPGGIKNNVTFADACTTISFYAFSGSALQEITIPGHVLEIGGNAFKDCKSLTSITISSGVSSLGECILDGCSSLQHFTFEGETISLSNQTFVGLPDTIEEYQEYGNGLYLSWGGVSYKVLVKAKNSSVTSIEIASTCRIINDEAFSNCPNLQNVSIDNEYIDFIGNNIFKNCASLKTVFLGDHIATIYSSAFENCSSLETINFPNGLTEIGYKAFYGCESLQSISLPNSLTRLDDYCFRWCSSLKTVTVPGTVNHIGFHVFANCSNLKTAILEEGVPTITYGMFDNCVTLESVNIPSTVTLIDGLAFRNCENLEMGPLPDTVTHLGGQALEGCQKITFNEYERCSYYGTVSNQYYFLITALDKDMTTLSIHQNCKMICGSAFSRCQQLTEVVIPSGVTYMSSNVFANCSSLTKVVLPHTLDYLGAFAFENCNQLADIFYEGIESEWQALIANSNYRYLGLTPSFTPTIWYYSNEEPVQEGHYWHYVEDVLTIWN